MKLITIKKTNTVPLLTCNNFYCDKEFYVIASELNKHNYCCLDCKHRASRRYRTGSIAVYNGTTRILLHRWSMQYRLKEFLALYAEQYPGLTVAVTFDDIEF